MTSKQTYPCFACRKAGFEVQVFLDGKDEQGRTKYLNEDGTSHFHQGSSQTQQQEQSQPQQQSKDEIMPLLKTMNAKLDRLISELLVGKL
jgi:hypothetical protein